MFDSGIILYRASARSSKMDSYSASPGSKIRPAVPRFSGRFQQVDLRTGKRTRHEGLLRISIIVDNSAGCIPSILAVVSGNSPRPRDYPAPGIPISPPTLCVPPDPSFFLSLHSTQLSRIYLLSRISTLFPLVFGLAFDLSRITSLGTSHLFVCSYDT